MESINNGGLNTVELKRDIYKRLLEWKRENTHKVLELEGARQVGKTFILDKFAKKIIRYRFMSIWLRLPDRNF